MSNFAQTPEPPTPPMPPTSPEQPPGSPNQPIHEPPGPDTPPIGDPPPQPVEVPRAAAQAAGSIEVEYLASLARCIA
jgi:hypothetical protein